MGVFQECEIDSIRWCGSEGKHWILLLSVLCCPGLLFDKSLTRLVSGGANHLQFSVASVGLFVRGVGVDGALKLVVEPRGLL